jgi:D-3-phosphoglycerate dehydrogenase
MRILGNDIIEIAPDFVLEYGVEMTDLKSLLAQSDFISLNCDLNPTSYHLIKPETLRFIKPEAILINTARGPIVDERALIEALEKGEIGGAALDVFEEEPIPGDSPLLKMNQVLLAPHNANSSPMAWERVHWNTIYNLLVGLGIDPKGLEIWKEKAA